MHNVLRLTKRRAWIGVFTISGLFWVSVAFAVYLLFIGNL
ncbi:TPA: YmiA family putative membrane protein [Escherichia coli]